MIAKELQDWFPEAQISDQPIEKPGYLTLPLASQQWILLEEAGLSERGKAVDCPFDPAGAGSFAQSLVFLSDRGEGAGTANFQKEFSWFIAIFPIFNRKIWPLGWI